MRVDKAGQHLLANRSSGVGLISKELQMARIMYIHQCLQKQCVCWRFQSMAVIFCDGTSTFPSYKNKSYNF